MSLTPPWISSNSSLSTLLSHEYLHVTSGSTDGLVWGAALLAVCFFSLHRWLRGRWVQGLLTTFLALVLLLKSGSPVKEEPVFALKSDPELLTALALGCLPAELTEQGCPGQALTATQFKRLFEIAGRAAEALNQQECVYVASGVKDVVACATNIPPTSLRKVFGHVERNLPSNSCQELDRASRVTHRKVLYELADGSFAAGHRELYGICYNIKLEKMDIIDIDALWERDIQWLLKGH